jgi:predicted ATP-binding protein involved in virulence
MRLRRIRLRGFRGFHDLEIEFDRQLTVLVGQNGAGKTSALDALSIMLSQYIARLTKSASSGRRLAPSDVNMRSGEAHLELQAHDDDFGDVIWSLLKSNKRQQLVKSRNSELGELNEFVRAVATRQAGDLDYLIGETAAIYYDQRRAVLDIPKRKRTVPNHLPWTAFAEGLAFGGIDFRKLTYWFQERESIELRRQRGRTRYVDPQLDAVRRAMTTATGFKDPFFNAEPPRGICVKKGREILNFSQLSTGEQVFLALAGDLARRLAILTPRSLDPLQGCAIVMIDELELHLHPLWQRVIIPWLLRTFPNCQFIVSTHSPQVLGEVEAERIRILLTRRGRVSIAIPDAAYGRDSNFLLASVLGATDRDPRTLSELAKIDHAIARRDFDRARAIISSLKSRIEGAAPELAVAEARVRRHAGNPS